jgi:hypothetical protein
LRKSAFESGIGGVAWLQFGKLEVDQYKKNDRFLVLMKTLKLGKKFARKLIEKNNATLYPCR